MASSSFACDVSQGFNFQKDAQCLIGHITSLKIGDKEFKKDLAVTVPTNITGDKVKVVGVISNIYWEGGHSDPIMFDCRVSTDNKQAGLTLQHKDLSNTSVEFSYVIYDYDPKEKKFYPNFHTNETDLNGLVAKSGGELDLYIDMDQATDVVSPENYSFILGVMPTEEEQEVHFAVNVSAKFVKKWGVTVAE
ncbi:hypothetical protein [Marinomonas spartinae]|uniref:hypothetical protein n=1 Tax=Marinomonas spartinae TaxID=1792290 RepID=UPI0018F146D3|nr:hypothetical protein [Marinomonas spartinae]MBJ7553417.1 hypothetical protein [Marinomonas spartinae]